MPRTELYRSPTEPYSAQATRPLVAGRAHTSRGLPFGASQRDFDLALQAIPIRDLLGEVESAQWLALDVTGANRAVAELQLERLVVELERRKARWQRSAGDPLRPAWPRRDPDLKARVGAVKAAWPIERFCRELLGCEFIPAGPDRWKARCPLPEHGDDTPSFVVYERDDRGWCYGCNRGGDVVALTGFVFGLERFYERLERLEAEAGLGGAV